jgi:rod shape-determining protein MreD
MMALREFTAPELPRVNSIAARLVPALTTIIATLVAILPLQIPGYAALTPALALMAVYHWTIYRPDLLPAYALFAIGIGEDLLTGSLVGVGALTLLVIRAVVLQFRRHFIGRSFPFVWAGFTLVGGGAMLALWALHCLLQFSLLNPRNAIFRMVLTIAVFPVASFLLGSTQRALIDGPRLLHRR